MSSIARSIKSARRTDLQDLAFHSGTSTGYAGNRSADERAKSRIYPPVKDNAIAKVNSFDELYNTIESLNNNGLKTNGKEVLLDTVVSDDNNGQAGNVNGRNSGQPVNN